MSHLERFRQSPVTALSYCRREILAALTDAERTGTELSELLGRNQANTARDLTFLYWRRLVTRREQGANVYYRTAGCVEVSR